MSPPRPTASQYLGYLANDLAARGGRTDIVRRPGRAIHPRSPFALMIRGLRVGHATPGLSAQLARLVERDTRHLAADLAEAEDLRCGQEPK